MATPSRSKSFGNTTVKRGVNRVKGNRNTRNGELPYVSRVKNEIRSSSVPLEREDSTESIIINNHEVKSCSEMDVSGHSIEEEQGLTSMNNLIEKVISKFEDGEPQIPEEGDEADTETLDYTDPEVFLLVYKWYLSPEKLLDVLIEYFRNGCIESEIVVGKSSNRKSTSKRVSTWSESTISISSLSEGKHLDDSPSVNGDLHDSKSLPDSIEGDIDKSDPETDENKRKSLIETESLASGENSSPRVSPNNDHSAVRKHSSMADSVFEGGRGSAAMNHSAGSLVSVGVATKPKKWSVIRFFRSWMLKYAEDFKNNRLLRNKVGELRLVVEHEGEEEMLTMVDLDQCPDVIWMLPQTHKTPSHKAARRTSLAFDNIDTRDMAHTLAYLDFKLFRRISFGEFSEYAHKVKLNKDTPRLEEAVVFHNGVTQWTICSIMKEITAAKRAAVIVKFIDVALHLAKLNSFNTLWAVVGAFLHFSIERLHQTWDEVPKAKKEQKEELVDMFVTSRNYAVYRSKLEDARRKGYFLPLLPVLLSDLVKANLMPDELKECSYSYCLNLNKYRVLYKVFSLIWNCQHTSPIFSTDIELSNILRAAVMQMQMNESELNDLSHAREPASKRNSEKYRTTPMLSEHDHLPGFSDFAKGGDNSQLDAVSIRKYVARMVDAVFQVYDTDNSGSISVDEFEMISSNFPFIQAFSELDMDKDGVISKEEMTQYFLGANQSLKRIFKHNFQECSYNIITPTYCDHCKGKLIGYVRQGYKCKDCNINCHKDCKDSIVVECNKKDKRTRRKGSKRPITVTGSGKSSHDPVSMYEDESMASLKEKLVRAEEARDSLSAENAEIREQLREAKVKIQALHQHLEVIRGHTIGFILEQMNTLHIETKESQL